MADDKGEAGVPKDRERKRVNPSVEPELSDEALESVAGGCMIGCSNQNSCIDVISLTKDGIRDFYPLF